jgi:Spy/CpxP family protein refolding chaperone
VPTLPLGTGSISGVVRMSDGTPAVGVRVSAVQTEAADSVTAMASLTTTDNMGRYRLEGVPPGRYYVAAGRVDLPTYYPGTMNRSLGTAVSIASAATVADIDFVIQNTSATVPPNKNFPFVLGRNFNVTPKIQIPNIPVVPRQLFPPGVGTPPTIVTPMQPPTPFQPVRPRALTSLNNNLSMQDLFSALTNALQPGAPWWTNANVVRRLDLTAEQRRKLETIFEQHRQTLVQNKADLEKEEALLAAMLDAEPLDSQKALSVEIDKVIKARGEMEKTASDITIEMRQVLTRAQWAELQMLMPDPSQSLFFGFKTR